MTDLGLYRKPGGYSAVTKLLGVLIAGGFLLMLALEWSVFFSSWQYAVSYSIALAMALLTIALVVFDLSISPPE